MKSLRSFWPLWSSCTLYAALVHALPATESFLSGHLQPVPTPTGKKISVPGNAEGASVTVLPSFVSYSIEFAFFPDFAGNLSQPNTFSENLLNNIAALSGSKPNIRVGGNTQDYALYDAELPTATRGIVIPSRSPDYPYDLTIGPSYFESYRTFTNTRYVHGFNLGKNGTVGRKTLLATAALACKALSGGRLLYWELGNEPDLFKTSAQGIVRPSSWTEADYVKEWFDGTRAVDRAVAQACPELVGTNWMAPSFAGVSNSLKPLKTFQSGLTDDENIALISSHNYIGGATQPGVTLQGTLMNHASTMNSVNKQVAVKNQLRPYGLPFILGETNSLYNQGRPGLSNSFGAALWGVDFNLYCASNDIQAVYMHQGTNYRYAAWQPIDTKDVPKGTKAPYYGSIAVAAFLGNLVKNKVQVRHIVMEKDTEAAYAAYENRVLKRIMVINMQSYNYTAGATAKSRPYSEYTFSVPTNCSGVGIVNRLMANGSDAITGITWDGYSYNYELENGKPVLLGNVSTGGIEYIGQTGFVTVQVPDSSAAMINLPCGGKY
ncbi:glycoside hydrolase family 79 protein [Patellaria atrata CBS 101060]|uniref:Glycoside hydrolase family 79 protein n=1 Tax=Patellaria atrata CBS 101060 TaxID=1346257 RepID=A0A9P4VVC2_9PEZI|nr:glycoside hydrolase family 79 protein [Patellaria atrata CBS 101060]